LEPKNYGNEELLAEGEGALSVDLAVGQKNKKDFALWKKSKANEPFWESPWGPGRPGWHIECSAMAGSIFPEEELPIDIHSGGVDLKFPHHDNEIAQSEAYYCCDSWINHFWHTGHLHIDGLKMSKSKKNFTTIKQVLEVYTAK
jgi:cysteinyl-tRNA synthetase